MKQTTPTHSQNNHSKSESFFDKVPKFNDTEAVQKTEDPFFTQNPQNAFFNKTNTANQVQTTPTDSKALIQRLAIRKEAPELTEPMLTRFKLAYEKFNTEILSTSPLTKGDQNQVLIYGVSQASHGMKDYASTVFYIGNNGYTGSEDYTQFTNLWEWLLKNDIPANVSARIVININLTINRSVEDLYATLLHEWFVHAVKWEGTLMKYIRTGEGKFAVAWIQGQGHVRRALGEHKEYANWNDKDIEKYVDMLKLDEKQKAIVIKKMIDDRERHSKDTGEFG